jgi:hypothetical protein
MIAKINRKAKLILMEYNEYIKEYKDKLHLMVIKGVCDILNEFGKDPKDSKEGKVKK